MVSPRQQLIDEMKGVFGDDDRRIKHALGVLKLAEKIMADEGGDEEVHDLDSFGALPLDAAPEGEEEEEVVDLNEFGALPLD